MAMIKNYAGKSLLLAAALGAVVSPAFGDTADDHVRRAAAAEKSGDLAGAMAEFNRAIAITPGMVEALCGRATVEFNLGDLEGALADYDAAISAEPDNPSFLNNRGMLRRANGDLGGALADYNAALKLKPDYADAYDGRGLVQKARGDSAGAKADFDKAIGLEPKNWWGWHCRGCLSFDQRDFTNALADFRKVIELQPSAHYARFRIWLIRARLENEKAATAELKAALDKLSADESKAWPAQLARYLTGALPQTELLAAANNSNHETETRQLSEAYFYIGSKQLLMGHENDAREYFLKSIFTGQKSGFEYVSAKAELYYLSSTSR